MKCLILIFISFLAFPNTVFASDKVTDLASGSISDVAYLRKLTAYLTGRQPTPAEYLALEKVIGNPTQRDQFFDQKIDELLNSDQHADKMVYSLSELYQVKSPYKKKAPLDGLTSIFYRISRQNLPWTQLLTLNAYQSEGYDAQIPYSATPERPNGPTPEEIRNRLPFDVGLRLRKEHIFLSQFKPTTVQVFSDFDMITPLPALNEDFTGDKRFAGSITTGRFMERYGNSALNKNRRRAAAVYRIFLCDSMAAAVPDQGSNLDGILDRIYPDPNKTEEELRDQLRQTGDAIHGAQKDCMACHFKLDPAGQTMINIAGSASKYKSPGALAFLRKGQLVHIPVGSVGELGEAISQQPEFVSCQVNHFWRWFIGTDVSLSENRRQQIQQELIQNGLKPWPLIKTLVKSPEFRKSPEPLNPNRSLGLQAKTFLQKCDSCHTARGGVWTSSGEEVPTLSQWPIGGNSEKMKYWLVNHVAAVLDLTGQSGFRSMPPRSSPWQPSVSELKNLRHWIEVGAPDENGVKQIEEGPL